MRPQTAMAAVFLVMTGTSVLLLRVKSARAPVSAEVIVTERGTPAPAVLASSPVFRPEPAWTVAAPTVTAADEAQRMVANAAPASPPKVASPTLMAGPSPASGFAPRPARAAEPKAQAAGGALENEWADAPFAAALASYRAGRFDEAAHMFDALGPNDPNAALWAARSVREGQGCGAAVSRFDKTVRQARQSPPGWDALLEGALCYRQLGDFGTARSRLTALLGVDSHKDRARAELARLDQLQQTQTSSDAPAAKAARARNAPPAAAAPPGTPPTSPPAAPAGAGTPADLNY
jgi:hypothetical protein